MRFSLLAALCIGLVGLGGYPPPVSAQTQLAAGQFQDISPRYDGAGTVGLFQADDGSFQLHLGSNFSVTPGPDLEVWLIDGAVPTSSGQVLEQSYISLGALTSSNGAQVYTLPDGADASDFDAVIIWCEDFSVLFTVAPLS